VEVCDQVSYYSWDRFKENLFKRFQGVVEKEFFEKLPIYKKNDVYEYTHKLEALETRVLDLLDDQLVQIYVYGLKPYIREELEMCNIATMQKDRSKEKTTE
jgi:hypothetical protein